MNEEKTNQKCGQLEELPITDIIPSGDNPRIINEKDSAFVELADSIRAQGVIVPVHVRIHPEQKKRFELLAGERRLRASIKADKSLIPAINHGEISDEQAFEITFTENYAREDLTPLEQGKAVVTLLEKYKGDAEAAASKMGKSIKWIKQREALGTKLSKEWKEALAVDSMVSNWTAGHLQLIARLPEKMQNEFLEYYLSNDIPSISELDKDISKEMQLIAKAPFDIVKAGCVKCQKRTSCQPGLFDDNLDPKELKKRDRCLDSSCWQEKTTKWLNDEYEAKKNEFPDLIAIATGHTTYQQDRILQQTWPKFYEPHRFKQAAKKDKDSVPGFIIFGKALGTILWVKLRSSSSGSSAEKTKGKPTPLAERRKMLNNKRTAKFLEKMEEEVAGKKVADLVAPDKTVMVMCLSHLFGVNECYEHSTYAYAGDKQMLTTWEDLEKLLAADLKTIRETLWENIRPKLEQSLIYAGPVTQTPEHRRKAAEKLASIFGVDFKIMQEKIADEMPEPKSWKNLNKDGTPRKAKKAKKKTAKKSAKTKQKKGK